MPAGLVSPDEDLDLNATSTQEEDFDNTSKTFDEWNLSQLMSGVGQMDTEILHNISEVVDEEIHRRSPEGKGASLLDKLYGDRRRGYNQEVAKAEHDVRMIAGAITECFDNRPGGVIISQTPPRLKEERGLRGNGMNKVEATIKLKDKNLMSVDVEVTRFVGRYGNALKSNPFYITLSHGFFGRSTREFRGETLEEVVEKLAQWVAFR